MASYSIRDPKNDHLLTPQNSILVVIDYQPVQVSSIASMDRKVLVGNIVSVAQAAKLFQIPVILSTVNVKTGRNKPTIQPLKEVLQTELEIDRTSINAWEDKEFVDAVKATGRKKIIMTALWTEACLAFPTLDALREGYDAYPVVDAIGGTSVDAHRAGLSRVEQAGAKLTSLAQLLCELQRDWIREETADRFAKILFPLVGA